MVRLTSGRHRKTAITVMQLLRQHISEFATREITHHRRLRAVYLPASWSLAAASHLLLRPLTLTLCPSDPPSPSQRTQRSFSTSAMASIYIPILYLVCIFGGLWIFSGWYKRRIASTCSIHAFSSPTSVLNCMNSQRTRALLSTP